jgi:hypothetical protein
MSILNNLKKVHAAVTAQRITRYESPIGKALNEAAVMALLGGFGSDAWKSYMAVFADNPEQLERLTVKQDDDEPFYISQMRAYIVSNAICDSGTNAFTNNRVTEQIDGPVGASAALPEEPSDPMGAIRNLRPAGLKAIPSVTIEAEG